jgi:hypothetical protein
MPGVPRAVVLHYQFDGRELRPQRRFKTRRSVLCRHAAMSPGDMRPPLPPRLRFAHNGA